MFKTLKIAAVLLAGSQLLAAGGAYAQPDAGLAGKVNTLTGTEGAGLTSGYLYPGRPTRSAWYSSRRPISPSGAGSSSTS